jgi:hypothetical protein
MQTFHYLKLTTYLIYNGVKRKAYNLTVQSTKVRSPGLHSVAGRAEDDLGSDATKAEQRQEHQEEQLSRFVMVLSRRPCTADPPPRDKSPYRMS